MSGKTLISKVEYPTYSKAENLACKLTEADISEMFSMQEKGEMIKE